MKIARIKVDGFGIWRNLDMQGLADDVTVLYGPNEAGKTTLMQFVRSLLYGFSPERRQRYLPPLRGGTPGGTLSVVTPQGRFDIARRADRGLETGDVVVTAPDGTQQGEPALKAMLAGVDESIFNNVYACGLREIQELGSLSETDAARYLYDLTAGLDRVSLVDVERELATSLERLLASTEQPSRIGRLLAQRAKLVGDLDTARSGLARFHRLAAERSTLNGDVGTAEQQLRHAQQQARLSDLAAALRDKWLERAELSAQLAALGPVPELPPLSVERTEDLNRRIGSRERKLAVEEQRRRELRGEARDLAINEVLWRQGPRIEALAGQREWIVSVEAQITAAETELTGLENQIAALRGRLGLSASEAATGGGSVAPRAVRALRGSARALTAAARRRREANQAIETAEAEARAAEREIAVRLSAQGESDLAVAMDKCGSLVGQLRRRMQLDERLTQMGHHQTEINEQAHRLLNRQMLPTGVLIALGSVFALGTLLVLVGLLMPTALVGQFGWALAILGLGGTAAAGGGKFLLERAAARELENCQKQLTMLELQVKLAHEERDTLDVQLPRGGGPLAVRLKTAEAELAALEGVLPLDARRQMAQREVQAARNRAAELEAPYRQARRDWRHAVRAAGLPEKLAPRQIRHLTAASNELATLESRRASCRARADQHRRELAGCTQRINQLAADAGVNVEGLGIAAVLERLAAELAQQETLAARRDQLLHSARQARSAARVHARRIAALQRRRRAMLRSAGVENQEELRRRALAQARFEVLSRQQQALASEIAAALENLGIADAEQQLSRQFADPAPEVLEGRRREAAVRVQTAGDGLKVLYEQRGCLDEQLRTLAADRGPAELRLELSTVERQLHDATSRWQELAVTRLLLDDIHAQFERERQPATLREASTYMNRLTGGHYPRVWTPLGERRLLVDDAAGNSLSPELLSEGTREQLFLSLRLALVARYAQRGINLPLVLDDVLVNFDADRAKAAARLLRDFARAGHQLLMFTCHEHIVKVFKAVKVETRTLPGHDAAEARPLAASSAAAAEPETAPTPRRRRKASRAEPIAKPKDFADDADDLEEQATYGILGSDDEESGAHDRNLHLSESTTDEEYAEIDDLDDEFAQDVDEHHRDVNDELEEAELDTDDYDEAEAA